MKPECPTCPCFKVRGCKECEFYSLLFDDCFGVYPGDCDPSDCVAAYREADRQPTMKQKLESWITDNEI